MQDRNTTYGEQHARITRNASQGADTRIESGGYAYRVKPLNRGRLAVYKHRHDWTIPDAMFIGTVDDADDALELILRA